MVRLSGAGALGITMRLIRRTRALVPRRATLAVVHTAPPSASASDPVDAGAVPGRDIDQAIVTYFQAPHSYTGEDIVEISLHGSPVALAQVVESSIALGARAAARGEFTLRAFLNGRIDLVQAEAVADLIAAATPLQARAAFDQLNGTLTSTIIAIDEQLFDLIARLEASVDFPEEGYHFIEPADLAAAIDEVSTRTAALLGSARQGRMLREGLQVAIVGEPNVGKSSLFNALLGTARAIVHDQPGTTRDLVAETMDLAGLRVTLVDTAGLRETTEPVELEGVHRSTRARSSADLVVHVAAEPHPRWVSGNSFQDIETKELKVLNKIDVSCSSNEPEVVRVSARTGEGLEVLRRRIVEMLDLVDRYEPPAITNIRHIALVERADAALRRARAAAASDSAALSEEFVLADLQDARAALEEVGGGRTNDDVLAHIFERFCVGK